MASYRRARRQTHPGKCPTAGQDFINATYLSSTTERVSPNSVLLPPLEVAGRNTHDSRMPDVDRHKLHFGPYHTRRFKYGAKVECESHGEVKIVGLTAARIPWPLARRSRGNSSPVLFGSLAKAVRREAACAVAHWWGVCPASAGRRATWRGLLGWFLSQGNSPE
jgi:hypothetical protein